MTRVRVTGPPLGTKQPTSQPANQQTTTAVLNCVVVGHAYGTTKWSNQAMRRKRMCPSAQSNCRIKSIDPLCARACPLSINQSNRNAQPKSTVLWVVDGTEESERINEREREGKRAKEHRVHSSELRHHDCDRPQQQSPFSE